MPEASPFDVLAEELGAVAGRIERESFLRIEAAISEVRRVDAERELRLTQLVRRVEDRLSEVKDGAPGRDGKDGLDGRPGRDGVNGKDGRDGVDGKDGERGADGLPGADGQNGVDGRDGANGKDGSPGRDGKDGERGERGLPGPQGSLAAVTAWVPGVHYEGDLRAHNGSTFQASRDTAMEPPGDDWICIASAGVDGRDGRSLKVAKTFDPTKKDYQELDVVALNGGSFVARKDNPGPCPGEGWQLLASQGKQGKPGERGIGSRGERGVAGSPVTALEIDHDGMLTLRNGDGSIVTCDLYPLLSKLAG